MIDDDTTDAGVGWANGVTLKRTRDGYSWTISVGAPTDDLEALRAAVATARQLDAELTDVYGPPREPARRRAEPRVHPPEGRVDVDTGEVF
jgi:hypothetical protein